MDLIRHMGNATFKTNVQLLSNIRLAKSKMRRQKSNLIKSFNSRLGPCEIRRLKRA